MRTEAPAAETVQMGKPAHLLAYAPDASQAEVYRLGATSLALALIGEPTGMFFSINLANRGFAWGNPLGFFVFCGVMVAATYLGLRARRVIRRSDYKLRGGWLGSAGICLSLLLLGLFGAGFLLTYAG